MYLIYGIIENMPPYYQPGKFRKKMARLEKERVESLKELRERIATKPKRQAAVFCLRIGKDVAMLREGLKITQVKLGGLVGTSQGAIGRIESGRHNLTVKNLEKIAKALGKKLLVNFE